MKEHGRELIPRKTLFGNPERTAVTISHDGTRIAYLAPLDGVLNVWVAPLEALERASPVTRAQGRGIRRYFWAYHPRFILYLQDRDGDENWHLFAADVETGTARDLTPYDGVQANLQETSDKFPEEVLIRLNRRDPSVHDLYRVNILTGAAHLVARNDIGADRFVTDRNFNPRLAVVIPPDGGTRVLALSKSGRWEPFMTIGAEDSLTTQPLCFDADGHTLYLLDSRGRDTSALVAMDLEAETERELARHPRADAAFQVHHPVTRRPQAVAFDYQFRTWTVLDEAVAADFEPPTRPRARCNRSPARWISGGGSSPATATTGPSRSTGTTASRAASPTSSPAGPSWSGTRSLGRELVVYYSLPSAADEAPRPREPLPTVLLVHGGPWSRDTWGYHPVHQLLASRGRGGLGELSRFLRLRQGVHERRRPGVGGQDARRPDRRRGLGGGSGDRRPGTGGDHGRQLRRLRDPGGTDLHPGGVRPVSTSSGRPT